MKDLFGLIPLSITYTLTGISLMTVKDWFQILCFIGAFLASIMTFVYYYNKNRERHK